MAALGALDPTYTPHATAHVRQMVAMIADLVARGHAYAAEGHVLFRVRSYADYGKLSGRSVDDMIAGARVEVAPYKEDPMDFVLWKPSPDDLPGWDSPWGRGRPGWHIECSAMAYELLGESFDIHGGGNDLQFPHHENEIAQSMCAHPEGQFARVWMHNEMLQVEGKKMSKSLGNFFTVHDLLEQGVPGEVIRFVFLGTHYRKPMDWTEKKRVEAENELSRWRTLTSRCQAISIPPEFIGILANDLNTPLAITYLRNLATVGKFEELKSCANLLGLLSDELSGWNWKRGPIVNAFGVVLTRGATVGPTNDQSLLILNLLSERQDARAQGEYARADEIRDALIAADIELEDRKDEPTTWKVGPNFEPAKLEALK